MVIIDFYATWCPPCKSISHYFEELAEKGEFTNIIFARCDVDKNGDAALKAAVESMPTFQVSSCLP